MSSFQQRERKRKENEKKRKEKEDKERLEKLQTFRFKLDKIRQRDLLEFEDILEEAGETRRIERDTIEDFVIRDEEEEKEETLADEEEQEAFNTRRERIQRTQRKLRLKKETETEINDELESDVIRLIQSRGGNKLSTKDRILANRHLEIRNGALYISNTLRFIDDLSDLSTSGNIDVIRNINNSNLFKSDILTDNQRNDFISGILIRKGRKVNPQVRAEVIMSGILSEERVLPDINKFFPDRDVIPVEDSDNFINEIMNRYQLQDKEEVKAQLKHWGVIDFIDKDGNLIELKSTGEDILQQQKDNPNFSFGFENLSKAVQLRLYNPDSRKLEIFIDDTKGNLFKYDLQVRMTNREKAELLRETSNPVFRSSDINSNSKLRKSVISSIERNNPNVRVRGSGNKSSQFKINIPYNKLELVREQKSQKEKIKSFIQDVELDKGLTDKLDDFVLTEFSNFANL